MRLSISFICSSVPFKRKIPLTKQSAKIKIKGERSSPPIFDWSLVMDEVTVHDEFQGVVEFKEIAPLIPHRCLFLSFTTTLLSVL